MPIHIIDNFNLGINKPIDNRTVVGDEYYYSSKESIVHKYAGLRVWDADSGLSFIWTGTDWVADSSQVSPLGLNETLQIGNTGSSIRLENGGESEPSYTFFGDDNTGMWRKSEDTLAFSAGGFERMTIDTSVKLSSNLEFRLITQGVSSEYELDCSITNSWELLLFSNTDIDYVNPKVGVYILLIKQDGVGNRRLNFAPNRFLVPDSGFGINLEPNGVTLLNMYYVSDKMIITSVSSLIDPTLL